MKPKIKEEVLAIYRKIKDLGFKVYLVGGCVRDLIMERPIKDWDLTTNATPEEIQEIFPNSFYDNQFGTVGIPFEKKPQEKEENDLVSKNYIEITTFRREKDYKDTRHPSFVEWGESLEEDLSRRDFTINAISIDINFKDDNYDLKIIDPLEGQEDIRIKAIRAVGDPYKRFNEDALRLMRAIRFAAQLGFTIENETWHAIVENAELIKYISGERIRDELMKTLASNHPYDGIKLLDNSGILGFIIPELMKGKAMSQERPGRHHTTDVFEHNLSSLKHTPSENPIVRFAALLHDVGKPYVAKLDENNLITFYNHEVVGARIAKEIAERLKLSKKQKEEIYNLIRWHMFSIDENITDSAVRRFIRKVGVENVKNMIDLRIGDRLGGGTQTAESWRLKKFKERLEEQLNPPFSINDMAVDGYDIMKELNIKPGPKIGEILNKLFEEVDEDLSKNNKEYLLKRIKELEKELKQT